MYIFATSVEKRKYILSGTHVSSTIVIDSRVDPLPVVSHISEDGVRSLTRQPVAHVSDEDMLAIDHSGEGTSAVSLDCDNHHNFFITGVPVAVENFEGNRLQQL